MSSDLLNNGTGTDLGTGTGIGTGTGTDLGTDTNTDLGTDISANLVKNKGTAVSQAAADKWETIDITKSTTQNVDDVESTPLNIPSADYLTNFCINRNTPDLSRLPEIFDIPEEGWSKYIGFGILGGILLIFIIWYMIKYYELIMPFSGGILSILKLAIIYTAIIFVLIEFFKFTKTFSWWVDLFIKFLKLTINPLLDDNVSFLYCYFTTYVNWLIYYPAMLFYLICLIGVSLIFFLIIVPIIVGISFLIAFLFSLLGDASSMGKALTKMKSTASAIGARVMGRKPAPVPVASVPLVPSMGQVPGLSAPGISSAMSQAPGMLSALTKTPGVSDAMKEVKGLSSLVSFIKKK